LNCSAEVDRLKHGTTERRLRCSIPDSIPNLWPDDIRVDIQSPFVILKVQADYLTRLTGGVLEGVIETETSGENIQHRLVIVARSYHCYRHALVTALHKRNLPYPVEIREQSLAKLTPSDEPHSDEPEVTYPSASSDDRMQGLLQKALRSDSTVAILSSLIANSNEAKIGQ